MPVLLVKIGKIVNVSPKLIMLSSTMILPKIVMGKLIAFLIFQLKIRISRKILTLQILVEISFLPFSCNTHVRRQMLN